MYFSYLRESPPPPHPCAGQPGPLGWGSEQYYWACYNIIYMNIFTNEEVTQRESITKEYNLVIVEGKLREIPPKQKFSSYMRKKQRNCPLHRLKFSSYLGKILGNFSPGPKVFIIYGEISHKKFSSYLGKIQGNFLSYMGKIFWSNKTLHLRPLSDI